jgi:hypothetical protein
MHPLTPTTHFPTSTRLLKKKESRNILGYVAQLGLPDDCQKQTSELSKNRAGNSNREKARQAGREGG